MAKEKNIALTGSKGAGKSTLADWLLEEMKLPWDGFRTVQYDAVPQGPLYEMVELTTGRRQPISALIQGKIRGLPEAFDSFGAELLRRTGAPVLLLDEIGRFEQNSPEFLQEVFSALDSGRRVIAVLKKENLPYLRQIRQREDTLLIDLDETGRAAARARLSDWLLPS